MHFVKKLYRKFFWIFLEKPIAAIFKYLPVKKNRIIFDNFGGRGYGENPKYIAEVLHQKEINLQMVWLINNMENYEFPKYICPVKIDSVRALYMRATAKVWIDNVRHRHPIKKKENQVYLQTWHGAMGAKRIEGEAEALLDKKYIEEAKYDGKIVNAILVDNSMQEQQMLRGFWLNSDVEFLRYGIPRNDQFMRDKNDLEKISALRNKLFMNKSYYYVLYAPTFRDDFSTKGYEIDFESVIIAFEKITGKKTKIIIRLHPNGAFQKKYITFSDNIIDGNIYPDIKDLSLVSNAVISDYSSSLFDFALLEKPAFVCALDYEDYKEKRGFIKEFYEFPFPIAKSNYELIKIITSFDLKEYRENLREFYKKYPVYSDGHSAEKTADWVLKHMKI